MSAAKKTSKDRERQRKAEKAAAAKRQRRNRVFGLIAIVAIIALVGGVILSATNHSSSSSSATTTTTAVKPATVPALAPGATVTGNTPCPPVDGSTARTTAFAKAPSLCIDPKKHYTATFDTNQGTMKFDLDTTKTPNTSNNFIVLSRYKFYDGTAVFRTDPSIDIFQGGDLTNSASDPGPGYTIPDEGGANFTYAPGDLVMARTSQPNSAGSQYFVVSGPKAASALSGQYVNFGHAVEGQDVIQKIMALNVTDPTSELGGGPSKPVIVNSIKITES